MVTMRLNRFYVSKVHDKWGTLKLDNQVWLNDKNLVNQILKVLRLRIGEQIVLFDDEIERIYEIDKIEYPASVHLKMVTQLERKNPGRHVYLMWSLLKKDKNEWVVQKGTELGVKNFVPIVTDHSEKQNLD
jgi:16S rRNA (uracil1498-N3)-methyltransferase